MSEFHKDSRDAARDLSDLAIEGPAFQRQAERYQQTLYENRTDGVSFKERALLRREDEDPDTSNHQTFQDYVHKTIDISTQRGSVLMKIATYFNKPSEIDKQTLNNEIDDLHTAEDKLYSLGQDVQEIFDLEVEPPNVPPRLKLLDLDVNESRIENDGEFDATATVENNSNTEAYGGAVCIQIGQKRVRVDLGTSLKPEERTSVDLSVPTASPGKQQMGIETITENGLTMTQQRSRSVSDRGLTAGNNRIRQTGTGGTAGDRQSTQERSRVAFSGTYQASDTNKKPAITGASINSNNEMEIKVSSETTSETETGETENMDYQGVVETPSGVPGKTPKSVSIIHE